jgi:hypothetical protein
MPSPRQQRRDYGITGGGDVDRPAPGWSMPLTMPAAPNAMTMMMATQATVEHERVRLTAPPPASTWACHAGWATWSRGRIRNPQRTLHRRLEPEARPDEVERADVEPELPLVGGDRGRAWTRSAPATRLMSGMASARRGVSVERGQDSRVISRYVQQRGPPRSKPPMVVGSSRGGA